MLTAETWIRKTTVVFGSVILCLMMLQVVFDVFLRSLAGAGVPATPDLVSKYYMVALSFLPLALTEVKRRQIEATIFTEKLGGSARRLVYGLGFGLSLIVNGLLTWVTAAEAASQTARGAYVEAGVVRFITWPSYWILPLAFGLMAAMMLMRFLQVARGSFSDTPHDSLEELVSTDGEET